MAENNNKIETVVTVYDENKKNIPVAKIALNGYNIQAGGPLGQSGAMRSFKLTQGTLADLWESWNGRKILTITAENGESSPIRIAALPVEDKGMGFVEFM